MTTTKTPGTVRSTTAHAPTSPVLDLVIPVYNEAAGLESSVRAARAYLDDHLPFSARLTIADNASTDDTLIVAHHLARELPGVRVLHLDAKGRGRALHAAWGTSDAQVLAYMDVDLSTHLSALLPLVAPLLSGHSEVAIGSRLSRASHVVRGPRREIISRCYNLLLRGALSARFSDAQCGFKAIRADAARQLLPLVADNEWFFDTELLVLAERAGLRIHEVPVDWVDDPDSRVDIVSTAMADLRGIARLGRDLAAGRLPLDEIRAALPSPVGPGRSSTTSRPGIGAAGPPDDGPGGHRAVLLRQLVRFGLVGVICTVVYALLFVATRGALGPQAANVIALLATALLNTALNRRHTFGVTGPGILRHHGQGLLVFGLAWGLTAGSLAALHALSPDAAGSVELAVLTLANLGATVLRFLLLRGWVFRSRGASPSVERPTTVVGGAPTTIPSAEARTALERNAR